ncbi:MAG TPA: DUF72 domain-containing protein [Thermodesulforhabdus norvegica]|uniref:DUF72 domain-containing protein n=1 Tax=Thermodesulforhabdus norvegica TaxID=39841 RepID=A0A7C1B0F8_9BACT|nr:DUF72 domain-containing protein [Thermodesulforhabdus norvegica]
MSCRIENLQTNEKSVFVGFAGWSYPDWKGIVFPDKGAGKMGPLEFISSFFDVVEVNSTFYRIPGARHVQNWIQRTLHNPRFQFTVKLYRGFSHESGGYGRKEIVSFGQVLELFQQRGKLGALLVQFPYRFHQNYENRKHLIRLRQIFSEWPMVVEFRHRSWLNRAVLDFLKELNVGFCNIDQPRVSYSMPLTAIATTSTGYLRCHGRNESHWFGADTNRDLRYHYRYPFPELTEIKETVEKISGSCEKVFVIFNNHFKGNEVFDAARLLTLMGCGKKWPSRWNIMPERP